jgi:hypothetical protein
MLIRHKERPTVGLSRLWLYGSHTRQMRPGRRSQDCALYARPEDGVRTAMIFFDMRDSSDIPSIVEPLFMGIDAEVELLPVMNADDLRKGLKNAMEAM